jgi:hypothetical protein
VLFGYQATDAVTTPVEPIPIAAEASLSSDAFLWGLDLFNHGYYWEAHEAWEGLWQVADRDGPLRVLFKGLNAFACNPKT